MREVRSLQVDYSTLSDYRRCGRLADYKLVRRRIPAEASAALAFGGAIHKALATWHRAVGLDVHDDVCAQFAVAPSITVPHACLRCAAISSFYVAAYETSLADIVDGEARSIRHGIRLIEAYISQYGPPDSSFTPHSPSSLELTLKMPLGDLLVDGRRVTLTFAGTIDGIVRDPSGDLLVLEHKTSFYLGSSFMSRVKPNDQITGYVALARANGFPVVGAIVNGLQTAHKKLEKEPSECFARAVTYRTPEELAEWQARAMRDSRRLVEDVESSTFSANAPDACTMFNTTCPFADVCNSSRESRPDILERAYIDNTWPMSKIVYGDPT